MSRGKGCRRRSGRTRARAWEGFSIDTRREKVKKLTFYGRCLLIFRELHKFRCLDLTTRGLLTLIGGNTSGGVRPSKTFANLVAVTTEPTTGAAAMRLVIKATPLRQRVGVIGAISRTARRALSETRRISWRLACTMKHANIPYPHPAIPYRSQVHARKDWSGARGTWQRELVGEFWSLHDEYRGELRARASYWAQ